MRLRLAFILLVVAQIAGASLQAACGQQGTVPEAEEAVRRGAYREARRMLEPVVRGDPGAAGPAALSYAETFAALGEYDAGLAELRALLERAPQDPYLQHALGRLLVEVGRLDEAARAFQAAYGRAPEFWRNTLALADLAAARGRRADARELYARLYRAYKQGELRTAEALGLAGRAAAALEEYHDANAAFRTAYGLDPRHVDALVWWAELFQEKYNEADAQRTYGEALQVNPHRADLYVGLARATGSFERQEELAGKALEANPNSVGALNVLASLRILDGLYEEAEGLLRRALAVNPASVEALAHLASIHHLRGEADRFAEVERQVQAITPQPGRFYLTVSENVTRRFRYPDAVAFARRAAEVDRANPRAFAALGTALLRTGEREEARRYLAASFDRDPFNLFVGNTLTLLDEYEGFETLESEHFTLLIHRDERAVLGPAILATAEAAYDSLAARYGYRPAGRILLEAYQDHDDFAVRVGGIPHLGLLGVSFGDVVAFDTPRAQAGSPYNWARTLWHELAHTMAIGVSDFRVPRWFTEGLSVYEESRGRPYWGREMDLELFAAFDRGQLLPIAELDRGFTRPQFPGQILLSYYHASKVIGFLVEEYGFESVVRTLRALRAGKPIAASLQEATGQDVQALDRAFRAGLEQARRRLASVLPGRVDLPAGVDAPVPTGAAAASASPFFRRLEAGQAALRAEDHAAAEAAFRQALDLYPAYVAEGNAYAGLAAVYRARGDRTALLDVLSRYLRYAEEDAVAAREVADLLREAGRTAEAAAYLERSLEVDPYHVEARTRLADLYDEAGRYDRAVAERRAVLALNPVDRAEAHYRLAASLYGSGRFAEAKRAVLEALELAPAFRPAQRLLLQCVERTD